MVEARISDMKWISESASEAEVTLTTSVGRLVAFCQPCGLQIGDVVREPVHAFGLWNAQLHPEGGQRITCTGGLAHEVVGTVIDLESQLMSSLGFSVRIDDDLPGGLAVGDQILISCGRLDIW